MEIVLVTVTLVEISIAIGYLALMTQLSSTLKTGESVIGWTEVIIFNITLA